jgi:hypothetical protein
MELESKTMKFSFLLVPVYNTCSLMFLEEKKMARRWEEGERIWEH